MKSNITVVGVTPDGKTVIGGGYYQYATKGFPYDQFIDECHKAGMVASHYSFVMEALRDGRSRKTITTLLRSALQDQTSYPCGQLIDKIPALIEYCENILNGTVP